MLFQKAIKVGDLVRNRKTREIWLSVAKSPQGIFVINLMHSQQNPSSVFIILPAHTDNWDRDTEIEDLEEWEKDIVEKNIPLIEEVEREALNDPAQMNNSRSYHAQQILYNKK